MATIESWWKYDSFINRLLRKKTIYHYVVEEDYTIGMIRSVDRRGKINWTVVYTGQGKGRKKK